jgi:DNA-binding CsgD family transcriptional regulator
MDHVTNDFAPAPTGLASVRAVGSCLQRPGDEAASLSALWTELVSGFCKIEQTEFTQHTCGVVVSRSHRPAGESRPSLPLRDREILERSLVEGVRKSVAADFGLCASSIAEILRRCFLFMGLSCWPSRIPLVLVIAAHAKLAPESQRGAKLLLAQNQQLSRQTISAVRPDNDLSVWLSPAEFAVTRLLIEGKSYAAMAALRQTSKRTVANQLASAFHRLGISGRAELLCLLAQRKLVNWQSGPTTPRPAALSVVPAVSTFATAEAALGFARVAGDRAR